MSKFGANDKTVSPRKGLIDIQTAMSKMAPQVIICPSSNSGFIVNVLSKKGSELFIDTTLEGALETAKIQLEIIIKDKE